MAIKGAILGDILGSQFEAGKPEEFDYKTTPLLSGLCDFTDDTVTTLAVKKATVEHKDLTKTMVDVCRKHINCGFGGTFIQWVMGKDHSPYGSWGNGSAMRVSYLADYYDDYLDLQKAAIDSAKISHDHEEGIKGAEVTATCIFMAKHGCTKEQIYDYVLEQYPVGKYKWTIANTMEELRNGYEWSVSCMDTVPVAMRCFYESTDYESFMRNIFSLNCDSDTFGAVAGGVAEEYYHGFGNIPADQIIKTYLTKDLYKILEE